VWWPARSKTRVLGFDRVSRVGRVNFYLKKIQNGVVLVKKKQKLTGCNRVLPGQPDHQVNLSGQRGSHRVTAYAIFFINPTRFQP